MDASDIRILDEHINVDSLAGQLLELDDFVGLE